MKNLFVCADRYIKRSGWKEIAMLKLCLFSLGILAGMQIPEGKKKKAALTAAILFAITCIPLVMKYIRIVMEKSR